MLSLARGGKLMNLTGADLYRAGSLPWYLAGGAPVPLVAYQPIGAASYAASLVNLANPGTYNAYAGVAPSWASATGWTANGTTQYLRTGITPSASWSALVRFSNYTRKNNTGMFGEYASGASSYFFAGVAATVDKCFTGNGGSLGVEPAITSGVLGFAGQTVYRNGVANGTIATGWSGTHREIYLMTIDGQMTMTAMSVQAFVLWNSTISDAQATAVSAAMAALTG